MKFNGVSECRSTLAGVVCSLSCLPETDFEFQPARYYKCRFSTGKFTPEKAPQCVPGKGLE